MPADETIEDLLRREAPQVLGALVRRHGRFEACEDAVQEALLAGSVQWPTDGVPAHPRGWLITVATRRLTDQVRSDAARRRREGIESTATASSATVPDVPDEDDTLTLLFLCCHPSLAIDSQIALTLRAVGGLATTEIARAFLTPEPTMGQRISRAKQRIRATGSEFRMPPEDERPARMRVVLHVLYLIFNEGYTATSGPDLHRRELTSEAVRLTREVRRLLPADGEVAGLLALMLLTEARRPARTLADGTLVPIDRQDRSLWDPALIAEGVALISETLATAPLGPYQLQAAIAAIHDEAPSTDETDWPQILQLYGLLQQLAPNPMVTINQSVALAMVHGPTAGLELLATLDDDARVAEHHRLHAVRAHLLEMAGDLVGARESYEAAARLTDSIPEQRYLDAGAARVSS